MPSRGADKILNTILVKSVPYSETLCAPHCLLNGPILGSARKHAVLPPPGTALSNSQNPPNQQSHGRRTQLRALAFCLCIKICPTLNKCPLLISVFTLHISKNISNHILHYYFVQQAYMDCLLWTWNFFRFWDTVVKQQIAITVIMEPIN